MTEQQKLHLYTASRSGNMTPPLRCHRETAAAAASYNFNSP
jgi:hypothetical protein